jgi:hypothetical protein
MSLAPYALMAWFLLKHRDAVRVKSAEEAKMMQMVQPSTEKEN